MGGASGEGDVFVQFLDKIAGSRHVVLHVLGLCWWERCRWGRLLGRELLALHLSCLGGSRAGLIVRVHALCEELLADGGVGGALQWWIHAISAIWV